MDLKVINVLQQLHRAYSWYQLTSKVTKIYNVPTALWLEVDIINVCFRTRILSNYYCTLPYISRLVKKTHPEFNTLFCHCPFFLTWKQSNLFKLPTLLEMDQLNIIIFITKYEWKPLNKNRVRYIILNLTVLIFLNKFSCLVHNVSLLVSTIDYVWWGQDIIKDIDIEAVSTWVRLLTTYVWVWTADNRPFAYSGLYTTFNMFNQSAACNAYRSHGMR